MLNAILSPHLDDAVLSCWCLLEGSEEATVVNVFTASPPVGTPPPSWDLATGATDPVQRMRERHQEDAAALALVARSSVQLGLLDDQYRDSPVSAHEVIRRIRLAVDPQAILHAPGAFNRHPDHVLVRDAALELSRAGWQVVLYADLPHATARGWPAWVTGDHSPAGTAIAADWDRVLSEAGIAVEQLVPRVHSLDASVRARKLQALAAYETQRAALDRHTFVPLEHPGALAWEVDWEVPPSALRDEDEVIGKSVVMDLPGQPVDYRG